MCRVQTLMTMLAMLFLGDRQRLQRPTLSPEVDEPESLHPGAAAIRLSSIAPPLSFHGSMVRYYFPHDTEGVRP
jgi:hypothetical protein